MTEEVEDICKIFLNACHEGNESVVYNLYEEVRRKNIIVIAKSFEGACWHGQVNVMKLLACLLYETDILYEKNMQPVPCNIGKYFDMMFLLENHITRLCLQCNENNNEQIIRLILDFVPYASAWFSGESNWYAPAQFCIKINFNLFKYIYEFDKSYRKMFLYCFWNMNRPDLIIEEKHTEAFHYFSTKEKENVIVTPFSDEGNRELLFKRSNYSVRYVIRKKKLSNWFKLTVAYVLQKKNLHFYIVDFLKVFEHLTPQSSLKH